MHNQEPPHCSGRFVGNNKGCNQDGVGDKEDDPYHKVKYIVYFHSSRFMPRPEPGRYYYRSYITKLGSKLDCFQARFERKCARCFQRPLAVFDILAEVSLGALKTAAKKHDLAINFDS